MTRRVVFAWLVGVVLAHPARAQVAPNPVLATPQAPPIRKSADVPPPPPKPADVSRADDPARKLEAKRSIARLKPLPAQVSSKSEAAADSISLRDALASRGQFANPGGVGRYAEYYTANTLAAQAERQAAHPAARFGGGGVPDRASQIAAVRVGQTRARNIQDNINVYGRPYAAYGAGFGFGFGLGAGRLYGYPR